jgi:prolyl-tRNA synthetase
MEWDNSAQVQAAQETSDTLTQEGYEVLLDDREQSPGSKLKDADLVGIPVRIVIGKAWQSDRRLEITLRATRETVRVEPARLVETVHKLLDKAAMHA